jgi:hypothetical protein
MAYNEFYLRVRRAEHSNNCVKARGLQRAWVHLLILLHEFWIRRDNRLLQRYCHDPSEREFCTQTLMIRALRIGKINTLKMRL